MALYLRTARMVPPNPESNQPQADEQGDAERRSYSTSTRSPVEVVVSGRCWPAKTPHHLIPYDAEGISLEEWRRRQPLSAYDDPVRRKDLERARAEAEKKAAVKKTRSKR